MNNLLHKAICRRLDEMKVPTMSGAALAMGMQLFVDGKAIMVWNAKTMEMTFIRKPEAGPEPQQMELL